MAILRRGPGRAARLGLGALAAAALAMMARAETVTLKNGLVYRGTVDKDNTIVTVFDADGLRRVIFRDSKIASTISEGGSPAIVNFPIEQPLTVHSGEMPKAAVGVKAGAWDAVGRRSFRYYNASGGKPIEMTQAINGLGPRVCKIRGIDGFWVGQVPTSTVPRSTILNILSKVDQKNATERLRVCRFLIQADWHAEARSEVARVVKDFAADPVVGEKARNAQELIEDAEARRLLAEIDALRKAQQPRTVAARLKAFPTEGVPTDVIASVRDQRRKDDSRAESDKALADAIRGASEKARAEDKTRLNEILDGLAEAPDAVRDRLDPFEAALAKGGAAPEALFALAVSGWVGGRDLATTDPAVAEALWTARYLAKQYLASPEGGAQARSESLAKLQGLQVGGAPLPMAMLTEVVRRMPPPCAGDVSTTPGTPALLRVRDDPNPDQPSEYAVALPPEYSPLRSYPMVVALHSEEAPTETLSWWSAEAARRGFIVIAPEYSLRDQRRVYHYTNAEHAAVELAIRDALKRFSADPDRVCVGGSLFGGEMAWDFGLAHPDLLAGSAVISGMPGKYVWANTPNAARVPFYVAMGDLAPAETDLVFGMLAKPLIMGNKDLTYVEYYRRGLEDFPEEAASVLDWMGPRRREPVPKTFDVRASRDGDDRFYGLVVREYTPGRTKEPAAVDPLGRNLKPATIEFKSSALANLLNVTTSGVRQLDVWVSPKLIDFAKPKMEVRVNTKTIYKGAPRADAETFLEDVRVRGDRSQVYWMRVRTARN